MQQLNVLPAAWRTREGPPPLRLMILTADALVVGLLLALLGWLRMVRTPAAERARSEAAHTVAQAREAAARYDRLRDAAQRMGRREQIHRELSGRRVVWSRKLAEWSGIVGDQKLWLGNLKVRTRPGPSGGEINRVRFQVWVAGTDERRVTAFRRSLQANPEYWRFFHRMTDPGYRLERKRFPGREPDRFYTFVIDQIMKEVGRARGSPWSTARPGAAGRSPRRLARRARKP